MLLEWSWREEGAGNGRIRGGGRLAGFAAVDWAQALLRLTLSELECTDTGGGLARLRWRGGRFRSSYYSSNSCSSSYPGTLAGSALHATCWKKCSCSWLHILALHTITIIGEHCLLIKRSKMVGAATPV